LATESYTCFAIAAPGLEPLVARELELLGEQPRPEAGGVSWEGDARSVMRANLWLRTASRVIVRTARFSAKAFYELERAAKKVPWEQFVTDPAAVEFNVTARKSKLYHTDAIAERLLSAVRSRLSGKTTESPKPKAESPRQLFVVRVVRDEFEISADTSGELLHMRGYRQAVGKAPLRETLAAALLLGAGYDGKAALLDPFCGSGTIPIEGALIARNVAPGLRRDFAVERWPSFYAPIAKVMRDEANSRQRPRTGVPILGSDRDAGAIEASRANAERAGVDRDIEFAEHSLSAMKPMAEGGLIATNPPYGVRVGKGDDMRDLFAQLGNVVRAVSPGSRVAMYLPDANLGRQTRLEFETLYKTSNGGLPVVAVTAAVS
jgi:putative N6-adenine-specific DNA methylase